MKDLYSEFTKDGLWFIQETQWQKSRQNVRETQFTLGNGYMGARGVLEEIPYDAMPGTYMSGIYDKLGSQVDELVNLPNPINFRFTIEGEKLDLVATDILEHKRILNMQKAVLVRRTLYKDTKKRRYDYQSLRFISMYDKNIGVLQIAVTPLDAGCSMDINTGMDTSVSNAGVLSEGRKKHFRIKELGQSHNAGYLAVQTMEKKHIIVYWAGFYYRINGKKSFAKDNVFRLKLKKGQQVIFTKIFYIKRFPPKEELASYKKESFKVFNKAFRSKFSTLLKEHIKIWEGLWKKTDILIEGAENLQRYLRFNIYHMLICAHYDAGFSSIGARTLSGEGYRGHIFWDAEVLLMPFYLLNLPQVAKNILVYRYKRLDKARELAQSEGFKGARFPWESADTGEEQTPKWSKNIDGTVIKIDTHRQELHITADIAYAVYKYYLATCDEEFMENYGYEMLFETARFWASRGEYNKRKNRYEFNHVIGPDEFHTDVNNNAYTNMLAKWNLLTAHKLFNKFKKKTALFKRLKAKINLKEKEAKEWKRIASNIVINIKKNKVIEQFDGYFKLSPVSLNKTDEKGMPLLPPNLSVKGIKKTQLVKQADVLMLLYMFDDIFSPDTKAANYKFYRSRTMHKSSLSTPIYSLLACKTGDFNSAYNFFKVSLHTDISNPYKNTQEGIHAAALGGTWQTVVFGFAGIGIKREKIMINPRLPRIWEKVAFSLLWQGEVIKFELTNDTIKLKVHSRKRKEAELGIFDKMMQLKTNKAHTFRRHRIEAKWEEFY